MAILEHSIRLPNGILDTIESLTICMIFILKARRQVQAVEKRNAACDEYATWTDELVYNNA
jgi:hypothetical protein